MPLNLLDAQYRSFERQVLPVCREEGLGVLGMKSLAGQKARLARELGIDWELCRRYAMSLPVSSTICGMQTAQEVRGMARIARDFQPLSGGDVERLLAASKPAAEDGHIEVYKDPSGGYGCSHQDAVLKAEG
jgi:hypothetical protein